MSIANQSEQEKWEYRRQSIQPDWAEPVASKHREQDPAFIQWVIETLEAIDRAEEGWRMVKAKIESDDRGDLWLDVLMKRPLVDAQTPHAKNSVPHAA